MNIKTDLFENERKTYFPMKCMNFSSQYGKENGEAYTATNLVKKNYTIYPAYGDYKEAFVLRTYGPWWKTLKSSMRIPKRGVYGFISKDFVEISFFEKLFIDKITIYETYNPGSVVSIYAFDNVKQLWIQIWSLFDECNFKNNNEALNRPLPPKCSRIFTPTLKRTDVYSNFIRLEFADYCHDYYIELDTVTISGTDLNSHILNKISNFEIESTPNKKNIFDLPPELIHIIMNKLDLISVLYLSKTCKYFQKIVSESNYFNEIDFQPYWNVVNNRLINYIEFLSKRTTLINLSWTNNLIYDSLEKLFTSSSETLTSLQMNSCEYLDDNILRLICSKCINLTELDLQSCKNIQSFETISNLSNLNKLNLYRTSINSYELIFIINNCSNIEYLNIGSCTKLTEIESVLESLKNLPNLKGLDLWRCNNLFEGLIYIAEGCINIEELDVGWCKFSFSSLHYLIKSCTKLKKLFLTAIRISDKELDLISQNLPNLEQLDILGSYVTEASVKNTFEKCKSLKFFDLSFCTQVTLFINQLREKYPKCSIKSSYQEQEI